jgi:ABC-2 type transport system permease protein
MTWGGTALMFGKAPAGPLFASAGAWLAFAVLFVALMTFLSANLASQAAAAGIGLGAYVVVSIAALWKPLATYSPAGLVGGPATLAAGKGFTAGWPVATSVLLAVALVVLAAWSFARKEL